MDLPVGYPPRGREPLRSHWLSRLGRPAGSVPGNVVGSPLSADRRRTGAGWRSRRTTRRRHADRRTSWTVGGIVCTPGRAISFWAITQSNPDPSDLVQLARSLSARTASTVIRQHGGAFALRADYGPAENLLSTRTCLDAGQSDRHWRDQRVAGVRGDDLTVPHEAPASDRIGSSPARPLQVPISHVSQHRMLARPHRVNRTVSSRAPVDGLGSDTGSCKRTGCVCLTRHERHGHSCRSSERCPKAN